MNPDFSKYQSLARSIAPWLIETRRHIHMHPELGRQEFATADYIESLLEELGVAHRRIGTAVVGLLEGAKPGRTVALRADIDALPVDEENELDFRSRDKGRMHACGHDAHTAIALGVAKILAPETDRLRGNIKFLFQPDEEGDGGAQPLIDAGALEDPHVDSILGLHVMPNLDPGDIEIGKGAVNGSSSTLFITIFGKGGHGAYPEQGIDAIAIAANVVLSLNLLVSRYVSPLDQAVLTIGTIQGGQRSNIIADELRMEATLRTTSDVVRDRLVERARSMVEGIPLSFGGSGRLDLRHGYPALFNSDHEVDVVAGVASELLGKSAVHWKEKPSMGVEDFSYFLKRVPGAFWNLGCGLGPLENRAPLHSGHFLLDEACLPIGVAVQASAALALLEENPTSR